MITIAGNPEQAGNDNGPVYQATFNNPHDLDMTPDGTIYVADRFGHQIRKITPDGIVSVLAGTGEEGDLDGPADQAMFNEPWGLCVSDDGTVYVADTRNNKIRVISPDGQVSTLVGTGNFGANDGLGTSVSMGNPTGVDFGLDGHLYVADHLTHVIRRVELNGTVTTIAGLPFLPGAIDGVGIGARFHRPYGIGIDPVTGDILVADEHNHRIRRVTTEGN
ncbi:MAG: hypothetical protein AAFP19_16810, partial [Bacteroidota bacterium]